MAMHSMTRRMTSINLQSMNESGIYSPTERCSSQQSLLSSTYDHFGHHHDAVSEKLLSHSIGNSAFRSPISTIQLSFQNWQRGNPKVFVAHMPKGMTRRDITEYFNQFGAVLDIYVPQPWDIPADQAGFAFVSFQSSASVQVCPLVDCWPVLGDVHVCRATKLNSWYFLCQCISYFLGPFCRKWLHMGHIGSGTILWTSACQSHEAQQ